MGNILELYESVSSNLPYSDPDMFNMLGRKPSAAHMTVRDTVNESAVTAPFNCHTTDVSADKATSDCSCEKHRVCNMSHVACIHAWVIF